DDHPPNLVALAAILEPLGQELVHAHSGEEALRQLLESDFALILMDVQMPGLDGIRTAKLIKERRRNRHIPIIFLTAIHKDPAYIFRGYKEGAVDYLLKPFDPEILRAKVSVFVDLWRKTELLRRQEAMLRATEVIAVEKRGELRFRAPAGWCPSATSAGGSSASSARRRISISTSASRRRTRRCSPARARPAGRPRSPTAPRTSSSPPSPTSCARP